MDFPSIQPPNITPGGVIRIVAPAGPIQDRSGLDAGIASLQRMGFRVAFDDRIFESTRYLAGADKDRAEELMRAFEDESVHAVMALRGGYGCSRLIPYLDDSRLSPYPKLFIGFSDLTTIHLHLQKRFRWITVHGPMAVTKTLGNIPPDQERHLLSLLGDPSYQPILGHEQMETWVPGVAEGILTGGCLAMVAASLGTPYEIETENRILFIEDLGEPPYRLDRMLTHLRLAGKLERLSGVLLGTFLGCEAEDADYRSSDVLKEILGELGVPVLANFPAGHGFENWAIPLGTRVRMDAAARTVQCLHPATRRR